MAVADNDKAGQHVCIPAELWMRIMCLSAGIICVVVGGIGNLTTLLSIATVRSLWRFTNINIFLLALSDLILTTFVCGHLMHEFWQGCWSYSVAYCHFFTDVNGLCYGGSIVLLALVSYDRYLMVRHGASYGQRESRRTVIARVVITLSIFYVVLIPSINLQWFTGVSVNVESGTAMCIPEVVQSAACYFVLTVAYNLPEFVMLFCYVSVLRYHRTTAVNAVAVAVIASDPARITTLAQRKAKNRTARAVLLVSSMFLVLIVTNAMYIITTVIVSMFAAGYWWTLDVGWWTNLYLASFPVAWLNNALNPLLYAYAMPEFRRAARTSWSKFFAVVSRKHFVQQLQPTAAGTFSEFIVSASRAADGGPQRPTRQEKLKAIAPVALETRL